MSSARETAVRMPNVSYVRDTVASDVCARTV